MIPETAVLSNTDGTKEGTSAAPPKAIMPEVDLRFTAAQDLRDCQFSAVALDDKHGRVGVCLPGNVPVGILQNTPNVGEDACVRASGVTAVRTVPFQVPPIQKGDFIAVEHMGAVAATPSRGVWCVGLALEDADETTGQVVSLVLLRAPLSRRTEPPDVEAPIPDRVGEPAPPMMIASLPAGEDLRGAQFRAVTVDGASGAVRLCGKRDIPAGILQNRPDVGEPAQVCVVGSTTVAVEHDVQPGELLRVTDAGLLVPGHLQDRNLLAITREGLYCEEGGPVSAVIPRTFYDAAIPAYDVRMHARIECPRCGYGKAQALDRSTRGRLTL